MCMINNRCRAYIKTLQTTTELSPVHVGRAVKRRGEVALQCKLSSIQSLFVAYLKGNNPAITRWHDGL